MTALKALCGIAVLIGLLPTALWAQEKTSLSAAERILLDIVLSDTSSRMVCYLSSGYDFGVTEEGDGHFILLKSGSSNLLVRDGTRKVFRIHKGENGPSIRRMDSIVRAENNFSSMAFLRKGRIHSYGGYGMWRNVDFFTVFDPTKGDWHPLRTRNTLKNEHCFHFYDPVNDRFYVKGSHHHLDFEAVDRLKSVDSVYRFDFFDSTWKTLGKVEPKNWKGMEKIWLTNVPSVITPFGLVEFNSGNIELLDMPGNGIFRGRDELFRSYHRIKDRYSRYLSGQSVVVHLRDTAFFVFDSADSTVVEKVRLTREEFTDSSVRPLYEPVPTGLAAALRGAERHPTSLAGLMLLGLGAVLAWRMYRKRGNRAISAESGFHGSEEEEYGHGTEPLKTSITPARLLDTLSVGERDMLKHMLETALRGESTDIETMNKILGVARKDESVQKTRRSIAVSNINEAFRIGLRGEGLLVERTRNSADKRKYLYRISDRHMETLKRVFGDG
jgi:hypothetical protein